MAGVEVTEEQPRRPFGEGGRPPDAERLVADRIAAGDSLRVARRAGALGRRVTVTGVDILFRPQPTINLLLELGDEETRPANEAAPARDRAGAGVDRGPRHGEPVRPRTACTG